MGCALNGHFNLLHSNKLRRAFSAQLIWLPFPQGVALGYDDSAPLGRFVAVVRVNRQALQAAVGAKLQRVEPERCRLAVTWWTEPSTENLTQLSTGRA